jgi:hypothetical protein
MTTNWGQKWQKRNHGSHEFTNDHACPNALQTPTLPDLKP